jgi:hypothetical protein
MGFVFEPVAPGLKKYECRLGTEFVKNGKVVPISRKNLAISPRSI